MTRRSITSLGLYRRQAITAFLLLLLLVSEANRLTDEKTRERLRHSLAALAERAGRPDGTGAPRRAHEGSAR